MERAAIRVGLREKHEEMNFYSTEDISLLFSIVRDNYLHRIWLKLLFSFGLTLGELINIRVRDLDFDTKKIKIISSKKLRHRILPLPKCLYNELKRESSHKTPDELIFRGRAREGKIHPRTIQKIFEKLQHQTGMEVSVSKIRKSAAIHLLQNGWEEKSITHLLGHSHLRTTRKLMGNCHRLFLKTNFPIDDILENAA